MCMYMGVRGEVGKRDMSSAVIVVSVMDLLLLTKTSSMCLLFNFKLMSLE